MAREVREGVIVSIDPHDCSVIGETPISTAEEVWAAVAEARRAQVAWRAAEFDERAEALLSARPALEEAAEELGSLVHREMGKPLKDAIGEAKGVAGGIGKAIDLARDAVAHEVLREGSTETTLRRDPLGVVAVVTPWNFPLWMPASLIYPALLTGNTVVHKPSERTPLTGARLTGILAEALPAGVLQHVAGEGDVGRELVESEVDMVAFVGSQDTGRAIMASCSKSLKRLVLELGGKDPMIVLDDADIEAAATFAVQGAFRNSGQVCCAVERVFVEESIAEPFLNRIVELSRDVRIGPLVDGEQREKVTRQVDEAVGKGARLLVGGSPMTGPGYHYPPTVLTDLDDTMEITSAETFGPVAAVRVVADAEEALRLANATDYGLGATVWTADADRGEDLAERVQAGMVGINRGIRGVGDSPWVGVRQSGFGFTGSVEGTRHFTQVRTISRRVEG
jgi:acyl-CoA reductase-like NAD-dependent aldehyde dehydrogenase